jgi:CheY-like chemotaxis protein
MNILVIDDDCDDIMLFTEAFGTLYPNSTIYRASNGMEGLQMAQKVLPNIVFLDINMPIMNGRETLLAIRKDRLLKNLTICMLSTTNNRDEIQWCYNAGADGFVIKPSSFEGLCISIRNFVQVHVTTPFKSSTRGDQLI